MTSELGEACLRAAEAGAKVLRDLSKKPRDIRFKGRIDLVTDADLENSAAISSDLANRLHLKKGDSIHNFKIQTVAPDQNNEWIGVDIAAAQRLLNMYGKLDRIEVFLAPNENAETVERLIKSTVPQSWDVQTPGARSEENGFHKAGEIFKGEMIEGVGGGTCQIASTLHAVAFFSGLDIIERLPHSRASAYIRPGLDATVVYPAVDLKLKNPFEFPVVIHAFIDGDSAKMVDSASLLD